jgi:hypothetical protein
MCDVLFDYHASRLRSEFRGTAALRIIRRKNDPQRKGHHPVLGRSVHDERDVVHQLKAWFGSEGRSVSKHCSNGRDPLCEPLFPRCNVLPGGGAELT